MRPRSQFDEVIQIFATLGADSIDKFCSGFKDEIGSVMGKRCDGVDVICDTITGNLGSEFACVVLGDLFTMNG